MSNLSLRHLYKVYPNGVKAVNDLSMEIEDKEFIVFVGPSGCGKSTTLRMIAGLEEITAGELYIGDSFVNHVEPKDRDIAMVFQNYALYPHMTVYENLAFGLKLRHVPQEQIHKKVLWAADVLKLSELLERKPKALSGGQRQRVSLGRAILRTPKVFLLDEPLSNLDAKLRTEMRAEIAKIHHEIATTFIYVTHDQVEAMTMGTRIVVMNNGYVQQIDTPKNLYDYPENKFVAGFIGTPQMNFFLASLTREGDTVKARFEGTESVLALPFSKMLKVRHQHLDGAHPVIVGLRCDHLSVDEAELANARNVLKVKISHFEELGNETLIYGDLNMKGDGLSESMTRVIVKQYGGSHESKIGDVIDVAFDMERAHFFDVQTEKTIAPRIPEENLFDAKVKDNCVSFLGHTVKLPPAIQVADQEKAFLLIPTDALFAGGSDFSATVTNEEIIKGVRIVYLESLGRAFFMLADKAYQPGETLNLGIDFKRIAIEGANHEALLSPLPSLDVFYGSYFDRANMRRSNSFLVSYYKQRMQEDTEALNKALMTALSEVVLQKEQKTALQEEYAQKKKDILGHKSYRLGTESLGKEGKKKVELEAKAALEAAAKEYEAALAAYKAKQSAFDALSPAEKAARMEQAEALRTEYSERKRQTAARYEAMIQEVTANADKADGILLPIEKANAETAAARVAEATQRYAALGAERTAEYDRQIKEAAALVATSKGIDKDRAVIAHKEAQRARTDGLRALQLEQNAAIDDLLFESKVFAAYINGYPIVTSLDINKKIVKGLGAQLFLSHYRFEVPHDAYAISEDGMGIRATVQRLIDYGSEQYAQCLVNGDEPIYVRIDRPYEAGSELRLHMDIGQARIFENKFDIRLY